MLRVVADEARGEVRGVLDEIVAEGARRMLAAALDAEVDTYLAGPASERVVRNGHAEPRTIATGAGAIEMRAPRVDAAASPPPRGASPRRPR